jgi:hypothetical protein
MSLFDDFLESTENAQDYAKDTVHQETTFNGGGESEPLEFAASMATQVNDSRRTLKKPSYPPPLP